MDNCCLTLRVILRCMSRKVADACRSPYSEFWPLSGHVAGIATPTTIHLSLYAGFSACLRTDSLNTRPSDFWADLGELQAKNGRQNVVAKEPAMKLYITYVSPYARLARILGLEKGLSEHVEIFAAKTRTVDSPYYQINLSGRVPYLIDDSGIGMEDSQVICAYLDSLDGKPRFHDALSDSDWAYRRLEAAARGFCEGIAVWIREMNRPDSERSSTLLAHEVSRVGRLADVFEAAVKQPLLQEQLRMAHLLLAVSLEVARARGLGDLTSGRPGLAAWLRPISEMSSLRATAPPSIA
jgi:glutathione S-transferase